MRDPTLRTRRPILFESFVETTDVEANGEPSRRSGRPAAASPPRQGDGASASIVAPPKDYLGIRLGPYKYIEWPSGEKELYDINKDPYELNNIVRVRNLFPIRAFLHAELTRLADLHRPEPARKSPPKFPLTREQAAQGRQAAARRRTAEGKGTRRKAASKRGAEVGPGRDLPDNGGEGPGDPCPRTLVRGGVTR